MMKSKNIMKYNDNENVMESFFDMDWPPMMRFPFRPFQFNDQNLYDIKNENGIVTAYGYDFVYAPCSKDQVSIELDGNRLTIKCGNKEESKKEEKNSYYYKKYSSQFSMRIPENVEIDNITATADDGKIQMRFPIKANLIGKSKVTKIKIN